MDESLWDAIARVERRHWWFAGRREIVARVLERRLARGAAILDVGCGTGFVLERLLESFDAWGVEPDAGVRARAGAEVRARILPGSSDDLAALDGRRFGAVLLLDVIEHVDDDVGALRGAARALAPHGLLLVTVPAHPWLWSKHDELNAHRRRYTRVALRKALQSARLRPLHLSHFNTRLFPLALMHRVIRRRDTGAGLEVPPRIVNRAFEAVFAGEAGGVDRGYPFGLSLLALAAAP